MTYAKDQPDRAMVAKLVEDTAQAADAWMRGDMGRYLDLIHHARGFTLTAPDGGPPVQYADRRSEFDNWHSPFADGEAELELTAIHHWDDTAILVMIERQHGSIGGAPDQDLSIRVTQVYRRVGDGWELVHRHADPLTSPLTAAQLNAIASADG